MDLRTLYLTQPTYLCPCLFHVESMWRELPEQPVMVMHSIHDLDEGSDDPLPNALYDIL